MTPARIAELLDPFVAKAERLKPNAPIHISTYIDILLRWNTRVNLTAIRNPEEIVTRHFGESLFAAHHLFPDGSRREAEWKSGASAPREGAQDNSVASVSEANGQRPATNDRLTVADVGSGAGFPGLPIKLWAPQISLTLIESNHKKATFLREVVRALALTDVRVQNARAESISERFSVVTLRAVERFEAVLPVAASLVAPAGRLALLIGASQLPAAESKLPDLIWQEPIPIPQSQSRVLVTARRKS